MEQEVERLAVPNRRQVDATAPPEINVSALRDGTVIDHLRPGTALRVLEIIGSTKGRTVAIGLNLDSKKQEQKDLIKIEARELTKGEVNKIALLSPEATVSIIRDYVVVDKIRPKIPDILDNVVKCGNPSCITNNEGRALSRFLVLRRNPLRVRCEFCERAFHEAEIELI